MSSPSVSILMPAYNSEKFIKESINSLLNQTFTDFELLVINDGSTDSTESLILSYTDHRIVYIKNNSNLGLIDSLNKGIELAKGKYMARMDADDICLPGRLQKQFDWLEGHEHISVVGCHVSLINASGQVTGEWKDDIETVTAAQVKNRMAWLNCLAHPSAMMRSSVMQNYRYQRNQQNTEDYDLWLRLLAEGNRIEKIPEKLLLYRVHDTSVTGSILRKTNPFLKQYNCKRRFLRQRVRNGKWGLFETKVLFTMVHNGIMGIGKNIKGTIKG